MAKVGTGSELLRNNTGLPADPAAIDFGRVSGGLEGFHSVFAPLFHWFVLRSAPRMPQQGRIIRESVGLQVLFDSAWQWQSFNTVDCRLFHDGMSAHFVQWCHWKSNHCHQGYYRNLTCQFTFVWSPQPFHAISLEGHSCKLDKGFGNIEVHQWRHLVETHCIFLCIFLRLDLVNLTLESQMQTVADQDLWNSGRVL